MILPQENDILRAIASQRVTQEAENIAIQVERQLAVVLALECDLLETFERMKNELESLKGFSTAQLFKAIDKQNRGFIDTESLTLFIFVQSNSEQKLQPTVRMINGLMRRILSNGDGKITYNEFAKLIKPVNLTPYLQRIMKRTKAEDQCVEDHRQAVLLNEQAEKIAY